MRTPAGNDAIPGVATRGQMISRLRATTPNKTIKTKTPRSRNLAVLPTRTTLSSDPLRPALDLGSEPKLDAALAEVDDRLGHVVVPALVLKNRIAMGQAEDVGDALRVEEIFGGDPGRHLNKPTCIGGRFRPGH